MLPSYIEEESLSSLFSSDGSICEPSADDSLHGDTNHIKTDSQHRVSNNISNNSASFVNMPGPSKDVKQMFHAFCRKCRMFT